MTIDNLDFSRYQLGWSDDQIPVFKPKKGINEALFQTLRSYIRSHNRPGHETLPPPL